MKTVYMLGLMLFLYSCKDHTRGLGKNRNVIFKHGPDSIELYNDPYMSSDIPDSIRAILHAKNDSLWQLVSASVRGLPNQSPFPNEKFFQLVNRAGFRVFEADGSILVNQKQFNKRAEISFTKNQVDTVTVANSIWNKHKNYILITSKWGGAYKE